jgi:hypothetical protein
MLSQRLLPTLLEDPVLPDPMVLPLEVVLPEVVPEPLTPVLLPVTPVLLPEPTVPVVLDEAPVPALPLEPVALPDSDVWAQAVASATSAAAVAEASKFILIAFSFSNLRSRKARLVPEQAPCRPTWNGACNWRACASPPRRPLRPAPRCSPPAP